MEQQNVAVVTGAGSGVGRATAVELAKRGWLVAIIGRREASLRETERRCGGPERCFVVPTDVARDEAVTEMANAVLEKWDRVDALVCAAGTNVPNRSLANVSPE